MRDERYIACLAVVAVLAAVALLSPRGTVLEGLFTVDGAGAAYTAQGPGSGPFPGFPVNLNTATVDELMMLPGIGPRTAERIVERKKKLKGFRSVDELEEVSRIGQARLKAIRDLVTVK